jgi:sec-independent protein translocase protein TatA
VGSFGWQELVIILVILLLLFGATKLPALARSMGRSVSGFKKGLNEDVPAEPDEDEKKAEADKKADAGDKS